MQAMIQETPDAESRAIPKAPHAGHFQPASSAAPTKGWTRTKRNGSNSAAPKSGQTTKGAGKTGGHAKVKINIVSTWDSVVHAGQMGLWGAEVSDKGGSLVYRWEDTYWREQTQPMGETLISTWLAKEFHSECDPKKVSAAWNFMNMRLRGSFPLPKRDTSKFIIPLSDAYLTIDESGVVQAIEPDPKHGLTYSIKCSVDAARGVYTPKAVPKDSLFWKFLTHAMPDEGERRVLQEQCAMSLLPGRKSECAWWWGKAGAGKGEMTELVKSFHVQVGNIDLFTLDKEFALEACYGASLVTCDEVDKGKWKESKFKTFVTGNSMAVGRKGIVNIHNYSNTAYVIINSNPAPFFTDPSNGVARRIIPLEWRHAVEEGTVEREIGKKIFELEARIVLDWLLEGVIRIVARGGKMMPNSELPESVRQFRQDLVIENNVVRKWTVSDGVSPHKDCEHSKHDVYAQYVDWATADGAKVLEHDVFWRMLWELPEFANHKNSGRQTTIRGVRTRTVRLALSEEEARTANDQAGKAQAFVKDPESYDDSISF